jgi:leucyl/phenylalanyl-tRNA--protein transferase
MRDDAPTETTPEVLLRAYAAGIFPMAESALSRELFWIDPQRRGILPLEAMHVPRRLARSFLAGGFEVVIDGDFAATVRACADRPETWINPTIVRLYTALHAEGRAHSVEIRAEGELVGGLYGVALGGAFFGESMFSRRRDASKFALVALVARLRAGGFQLLDTQFVTAHLATLGAIEIPRAEYRRRLRAALAAPGEFMALPPTATPQELLQLTTQTS